MQRWWPKRFRVLTIFVLIFSVSHSLTNIHAQAGRAELTGIVTDANGAPLANANITVTETNTNQSYETTSGTDGNYNAVNLKPGSYRIEARTPNFAPLVREGVTLATGERVRVDLMLSAGGVAETVTVREDASLLRSETSGLGQVIGNRKIVEIPLNGRNFLSLVTLSPGVAQPPPTSAGPSLPRIGGGRPRTNEYLFDGISVLQPEPGQVAFFPIVDAIREFKVEVNNPSAEFGRFNGGVVNLTTKSGTNDYHGTLFEFLRNEALNARNLFSPATVADPQKPIFRRNQFGGTIGGRVIRDRTFFFADYQGTRQSIGRTVISTVPTSAQRRGDFSAALGASLYRTTAGAITTVAAGNTPVIVTDTNGNQIQARAGQILRPGDARAYAGNVIPPASFDRVAQTLLARYPSPTSNGAANNYRRTANESQNQDQFDGRVDHRFGERDQMFARYSYFKDDSSPVTPLPDGGGNISSGILAPSDTRAHSIASNYIHIFTTNIINEFRFGYTRRALDRTALLLDAPPSQSLQIPGIPANAAFQNELPTFTIPGYQQLGAAANTDSNFRTDVAQFFDDVAIQSNRHSLKFGVDFRRSRLDVIQPPSPTGQFTFSAVSTALAGTTNTGAALASFLLGQVQNFSIDLQQQIIRPRARSLEFFAQDDWRFSPRLTLNMGLRYTLNYPSTELDNQGAIFNLGTRQLDYLGRNGISQSARRLHKLNFAPRLGLAYLWGEKTVFRTGYGVTFIEQAGITTPFTVPQFPFIQTVTQRSLDGTTPAFVLARGPSVAPIAPNADAGLGQGVFTVDRHLGSGYVQQWNIAVQREVTKNLVAEIAYAGSKITHVGIPDTNINQLSADQLALGPSLLQRVANPYFGTIPRNSSLGDPTIPRAQLLRPFPQYTTVSFYRNNVGNTNYNALQAKLEQRFSRGLTFLIAYTRSKLIDEASSVFDASILTGPVANFPVADSFNRRLERDLSTGDIPNVFVASFTYELPFGRDRRFNPQGLLGTLIRGWNLTGIVTLQSGVPVALTQVTNFNAFAGFGTQRPNRIGDPVLPTSQRTTARWFDTSAFAIAPQFTLGNSSRNPVRGPGYNNADIALIKRTRIGEERDLELRAEFFNLTNTPPLGAPNAVAGSAAFGTITSAGDPRIIQLGLKFNF